MIELPHTLYFKAKEALEGVEINTLFALFVAEQSVKGKIFVDCLETPTVFYIAHPYGMSLLVGQTCHERFNHNLKAYLENAMQTRKHVEWLQVYPTKEWMTELEYLLGEVLVKTPASAVEDTSKVLMYQRINYRFSHTAYHAKKSVVKMENGCRIIKTSKAIFEQIQGSVIPKYFWDSAEAFEAKSIGYSVVDNEENVLATAFASFIHENKLELGIETHAQYRGKGYAYAAASWLIDFCLEHHFEPIWACSSLNYGSQKLAEKLGFEVLRRIPYYKLSNC